jgi:hypothetical protein
MRYLSMLFAPVLIMSTATVAFSKDEATAQCESPTAMKLYDKGIFVAMINTRSMTMNGKEVTRESVSRMDSAEKEAMEQLAKATDAAILAYRSGLNLYEAKRDVNGKASIKLGTPTVIGGRPTQEPQVYVCAVSYDGKAVLHEMGDKEVEFTGTVARLGVRRRSGISALVL